MILKKSNSRRNLSLHECPDERDDVWMAAETKAVDLELGSFKEELYLIQKYMVVKKCQNMLHTAIDSTASMNSFCVFIFSQL